jgi:Family of unknown function (DUF6152)
MKAASWVFAAVAWLLISAPASPHHSFAAEFDLNRRVTLTGSIAKIEWTNPHAWVFVDVKRDNGKVETWAIELIGANGLLRRGVTRERMKVGDLVTVEGFGARDGSNTGNASSVTLGATGEQIYAASGSERD